MGLDISVYKVLNLSEEEWDKDQKFRVIDSDSSIVIFDKYAIDKELEYYNWEETCRKAGFEIEQLEYSGMSFDVETSEDFQTNTTWINLIHPLYESYKFLNDHWSQLYCESLNELENHPLFKEFQEKHLPNLIKNGYKPFYKFFASGNQTTYYNVNSARNFVESHCIIVISDIVIEKKIERCIAITEVGYQRKGANKLFYEENMWSSDYVSSKEILLQHWERYFTSATPDSEGGWGSNVEYHLTDDEMRAKFKENIIDNFIEGETFVSYE